MVNPKLVLTLVLFISINAFSQVRDQSFNNIGRLNIDVDGHESDGNFFLQSDNKLLVTGLTGAGSPVYGTKKTFLTRYDAFGNPDSSYGEGGIVKLYYGSNTYLRGSILISDQKAVILTSRSTAPPILELTRLNQDGSADTTFGTAGVLQILQNEGFYSVISGSFLEHDGQVYLSLIYKPTYAGLVQSRLYCFNPDGTLHMEFGTGGYTALNFGFEAHYLANLTVHDGGLFVSGFVEYHPVEGENAVKNALVLKLDPATGAVSDEFGSDGYVLDEIAAYADLDFQSDGKMVLTGWTGDNPQGTTGDIALVRLTQEGDRDSTFGTNGVVIQSLDMYADYANEAVITGNGKLVVGGSYFDYGVDGMLIQFNPDGTLSDSFGSFGNYSIFNLGTAYGNSSVNRLILTGDTLYTLGTAVYSGTTGRDILIHKIILNQGYNAPNMLNINVSINQNCVPRPARIQLFNPGGVEMVQEFNTLLSASGEISVTDIAVGYYDVFITIDGYLSKGFSTKYIGSGYNTFNAGAVKGGDINNDNFVNLSDFSLFASAFGTVSNEGEENPAADLNCDGVVGLSDLSVINLHYGENGDVAPIP